MSGKHSLSCCISKMSLSNLVTDENISGAKVDPLASDVKDNAPLDASGRGSAGTDRTIGK